MSPLLEETRQQWAENIKAQREARGWSQTDLAIRVGVHRSTVSLWESAKRGPLDEHKLAIAAAFGMAVRTLFPLVQVVAA